MEKSLHKRRRNKTVPDSSRRRQEGIKKQPIRRSGKITSKDAEHNEAVEKKVNARPALRDIKRRTITSSNRIIETRSRDHEHPTANFGESITETKKLRHPKRIQAGQKESRY
ncbi:hypothetical protein Btru_044982 [Bulinus truncatus]|nr:hypothetical protein Btru_044982 [Bulinus truncatus]